jgi:hypothetical protein
VKNKLNLTLIALLYLTSFNVALALPPVILTDDQTTKLDLTSESAASINLLDCYLRVEGQSPNFRLVHSKGELPIPLLAIKTMQDGVSVEIAVQGTLAGLPVNRMLLHYVKNPINYFTYSKSPPSRNANNGKLFPQTQIYFLIQGEEAKVAPALKKKFGKKKVFVQPSDITDERVIILFSRPDLENVGGYGFYPWFQMSQVTQVEYHCVFE